MRNQHHAPNCSHRATCIALAQQRSENLSTQVRTVHCRRRARRAPAAAARQRQDTIPLAASLPGACRCPHGAGCSSCGELRGDADQGGRSCARRCCAALRQPRQSRVCRRCSVCGRARALGLAARCARLRSDVSERAAMTHLLSRSAGGALVAAACCARARGRHRGAEPEGASGCLCAANARPLTRRFLRRPRVCFGFPATQRRRAKWTARCSSAPRCAAAAPRGVRGRGRAR